MEVTKEILPEIELGDSEVLQLLPHQELTSESLVQQIPLTSEIEIPEINNDENQLMEPVEEKSEEEGEINEQELGNEEAEQEEMNEKNPEPSKLDLIKSLSAKIFGDDEDLGLEEEEEDNIDIDKVLEQGLEDSDEEKSTKKKKVTKSKKRSRDKKSKKSKKSKKKKQKIVDESEDEEEQPQKKQKELNDFDITLENLKKGKRTRRGKGLNQDEVRNVVDTLLTKMDDAVDLDNQMNKDNIPAANKLVLLPEVCTFLNKIQLLDTFVERGLLTTVRKWLEPLPDGSLPSLNIRTTILQLLAKVPVNTEDLRSSGLGRIVNFLYANPEETPSNKKLAFGLITKWSRPIFGLSERYTDLEKAQQEQAEQRDLRNSSGNINTERVRDSQRGLGPRDEYVEESNKIVDYNSGGFTSRYHASVPQKSKTEYLLRPQSFESNDNFKHENPKKKNIEKALLGLKANTKMQRRISIEGK